MTTCKDCFHYKCCQFHITEETNLTTNECSNFDNNKNIQQTPCKVGDTIYVIQSGEVNMFTVDMVAFSVDGIVLETHNYGEDVRTAQAVWFGEPMFNKTVFFDLATAEANNK